MHNINGRVKLFTIIDNHIVQLPYHDDRNNMGDDFIKDIIICQNFKYLPIIHSTIIPTLDDISERLSFGDDFINSNHQLYILVDGTEKIGNYYVSSLRCLMFDGLISSITYKEIKLTDEELKRRYEMIATLLYNDLPFAYDGDFSGNLYEIDKIPFEDINDIGYLWNMKNGKYLCKYRANSDIILENQSNQLYGKFLVSFPSLHSFSYYGYFKPSLGEVLHHIPDEIISTNSSFMITTNYKKLIGSFHIGETIIWTREEIISKSDNDDNNDEKECMICLSELPNTMVLPCGHIIVCETCSRQLEKTNNALICVKCRQPIDEIIYPNYAL